MDTCNCLLKKIMINLITLPMYNFNARTTCPRVFVNISWIKYNAPELVGFRNRDSSVIWNTECHGDSGIFKRVYYITTIRTKLCSKCASCKNKIALTSSVIIIIIQLDSV